MNVAHLYPQVNCDGEYEWISWKN